MHSSAHQEFRVRSDGLHTFLTSEMCGTEDRLAKLQRKLARAKKGLNNRRAIKDKVAKLLKRINFQRDDFCISFLGCISISARLGQYVYAFRLLFDLYENYFGC